MSYSHSKSSWKSIVDIYDPIKCGSIDGTDTVPHDKAIVRALNSNYKPYQGKESNPRKSIFIGRLHHSTLEDEIKDVFSTYGHIKSLKLIRDIVTGFPKGYCFLEFEDESSTHKAVNDKQSILLHNQKLLVDYEFGRNMKNWVPRRLGGGFGGKKESGQLRFGCKERPFKKPLVVYKKHHQPQQRAQSDIGQSHYKSQRQKYYNNKPY